MKQLLIIAAIVALISAPILAQECGPGCPVCSGSGVNSGALMRPGVFSLNSLSIFWGKGHGFSRHREVYPPIEGIGDEAWEAELPRLSHRLMSPCRSIPPPSQWQAYPVSSDDKAHRVYGQCRDLQDIASAHLIYNKVRCPTTTSVCA